MRILILACILLLCSCYTKKQAIRNFCSGDTIRVVKNDTFIKHTRDTFYVAGDTVRLETKVNVDCIDGKPKFKKQSLSQKKGKTTASVDIDSTGNLLVNCKTDSLMQVIDSLTQRITSTSTSTVHVREAARWFEILHDARWFIITAFFIGLALGLYIQFRR